MRALGRSSGVSSVGYRVSGVEWRGASAFAALRRDKGAIENRSKIGLKSDCLGDLYWNGKQGLLKKTQMAPKEMR